MQTLTFTQKLLRQRRFLSSLIPLFALFVGLGASQSVQAQSSIASANITLNVKGTPATYNVVPSGTGASNFANQDFGSFNIASDVFKIDGDVLTINEDPAEAYTQAELRFRVVENATLATVISSGFTTIPLVNGGLSGGVRTFTLTNAGRDLLALITSPASGASNRFDVNIVASDNINGTSLSTGIRKSVFTATGTRPAPNGATISSPTVIVDQGNGSVTYNASAFNNTNLVDQDPTSSATPSFNINTGKLILKGGSVQTTETGASQVNGAFLDYIVYAPNFTSTISTGSLQLTQTGGPSAGGVRTFSLATGTTNLIGLVPNAANGYIISVSYHATYQNNGVGAPVRVDNNNSGPGYNATFDVDGVRTPAPTITANNVIIAPGGGTNVTYNLNSANYPTFQGADLNASTSGGSANTFDVNNGQLLLNGGTVTTTEAGPNVVGNVVLYYRVRTTGGSGGAYQFITLTQTSGVDGGTKTFALTTAQRNLIASAAVTTAGNYSLDIYFQANGTGLNGTPFTVTDPASISNPYTATFTVTGVPIAQTIWVGGKNDNWFDAANWSNGVPTATVNALVRDLGAGNTVPYPNIYSDYRLTDANGALIYDNTGSGPAKARTLTMGGSSQAARSITRLVQGRLIVYGDFNNDFDSFIQRDNTVIEFGGADQAITGGSFVAVEISGGGTKANAGLITVSKSITFTSGLLTTDISKPLVSLVVLTDRAAVNTFNGAQLIGENDVTYLRGFVRTTRQAITQGETYTLGGIGLDLTFLGNNNPGTLEVTRNTVEAYSPINTKYGIRRIFGVRPGNPATNSGGLNATMVFHYRDSETMNLGGPNTFTPGTQSIPEPRLTIFLSTNSGNTFQLIGRDGPVDVINNTVTRSGVKSFATFTLGDTDNPLPVRLTAFDAKRVGADAFITWQTATELNSKGYDVQVSTNGTEFRTLGSIPSASPNTVKLTSYSYTDTEKNKAGTRYYRLRQVDLDGKEAFFGPIAVSFEGKVAATTLVAYPNPFNGNDELHVALQSATAGKGQLLITDMTGRTIRKETVEVTVGITDFAVNNLGDLKSGLYLVKFTLPSGEVKNLKVMKQ